MNVRRSTSGRWSRHQPGVRKSGKPQQESSEIALLGPYQQQVAELEWTITQLRRRVTELKTSTSELLDARAHLLDLFQNAPVGYVIHDHSGAIFEMNLTARTMLGLKREQAVSLTQFVDKKQLSAWLEHLHRANTLSRTLTDILLHTKDGKLIPVQLVTLAFRSLDSPTVFRTVLIDNSVRRAAEAALAQTQQTYHRLIDTIEGIVWEADAHSLEVTFVSRYAERLLGYRLNQWTTPGFLQNRIYVEDRDRVVDAIARAVAKGETLRLDYRVVAANRRIVWLHDNITTLGREGQLRLLGVAVEVTEQHQAAESLRQNHELLERHVNERTRELRATLQELESFSYSISHDLRAPLRSMLGFAEIALRSGGDGLSPQVQECLRRIMDGGLRADQLVQDVLAYSRVSRDKFQLAPVDLDKFVQGLIAQYPEFQPPKAQVTVKSPLLPVQAHSALLAQCLTNLLGNAVKFVAPETQPQIKVWTERPNGESSVRLWIEDNGIGIDSENLGRIFNMFERVHSSNQFSGSGIGLAIVRKATERLGGIVGVESAPGRGSKFWLQLKAA